MAERDTFEITCRKCGRSMQLKQRTIHPSHVEPGGGDAPLCPACGESTGLSEPCRGHSAEFARGMRRAVEIATAIMRGAGRNMLALDVEEAVGKEIG